MWRNVAWILILISYVVDLNLPMCCEASSPLHRMLSPTIERNTHRRPQKSRGDGLEKVTVDYFQEFEELLVKMKNSYYIVGEGIMDGLELSVSACKEQFQWDLWNCPVTANSIVSKSTHSRVTKEIAFLQAITAAGVMYSTTKTCTRQDNALCSCGSERDIDQFESSTLDWQWGGCSHNVKFGEKVSKSFLGTEAASANVDQVLKSHNERAGHMVCIQEKKTI
ncbi:hypothetical protein ACF0H5_000451 [Mactra antiquata]